MNAGWTSRHGSARNRRVDLTSTWGELEEQWTSSVPGAGELVVADDAVFVGAVEPDGVHGSRLACFDAGSGGRRWTVDFEPGLHTTPKPAPCVLDGTAVIGWGGIDMREHPPGTGGGLTALDLETGEPRWSVDGTRCSAPSAESGTVYTVQDAADGQVRAYDVTDGTPRWGTDRPDSGRSFTGTPAVDSDLVAVGTNEGDIVAFDAETGTERWCFEAGTGTYAAPVLANGVVLAPTGIIDVGVLHALDRETGTPLWSFGAEGLSRPAELEWDPRGATVFLPSAPAVARGQCFVVLGTHLGSEYLQAIDLDTGEPRWRQPLPDAGYNPPTAIDDAVVVGTNDALLRAYDPETGEPLRSHPLPGTHITSPAVAGGRFVITASREGSTEVCLLSSTP